MTPAVAFATVVCAATAAVHTGLVPTAALAATPDRVTQGRVWLLLTSGLLVDHPVGISLACFTALAALAFAVCGPRVFWLSALLGHVGSTLAVYLLVAVARLGDPTAFQPALTSFDYGVSAVSAAWLGAIATIGWRARASSPAGRAAIALSTAAVGLFAYSVRPDVTILSSEHLVAFGIGVALARQRVPLLARLPRVLRAAPWLRRVDPVTGVAVALTAGLLFAATVPEALADFRTTVLDPPHPSAHTCASNWDKSRTAPRAVVAGRARLAVVAVQRRAAPRTTAGRHVMGPVYCTYAFTTSGRTIDVAGRWRHGHVAFWERPTLVRPAAGTAAPNAAVSAAGLLLLRKR